VVEILEEMTAQEFLGKIGPAVQRIDGGCNVCAGSFANRLPGLLVISPEEVVQALNSSLCETAMRLVFYIDDDGEILCDFRN